MTAPVPRKRPMGPFCCRPASAGTLRGALCAALLAGPVGLAGAVAPISAGPALAQTAPPTAAPPSQAPARAPAGAPAGAAATAAGTPATGPAGSPAAGAKAAAKAAAKIAIPMVYLRQEVERPPVLSNLDPIPEDLGIAGAEVALADTKTTGRFLGHDYAMEEITVAPGDDLLAAAREALAAARIVFIDMGPDDVLRVADLPEAKGALLFNTASGAGRLRSADCRANVMHTLPEDGMRTDALMQVLQARRWTRLVMIVGPHEADRAYAERLRASAKKFGLKLLAEKDWTFQTDLRRAAGAEVPLFTQGFPDHDVLLVADETDDFGRYIPGNTWLPRLVAGTEGLRGEGWDSTLEQWAAVQLQNRFEGKVKRKMLSRDYAAWTALRTIGEAVTRTGSADPAVLRAYILSDAFALDGFKGRSLTYRAWDGQLRQPMPVVSDRALVELTPLDGYLHQTNTMDTLGLDRPDSACRVFGDPS